MKRVVILGGGTFSPIRNHLSLSAPAFGTTARKLQRLFMGSSKGDDFSPELILTKMANHESSLKSNEDVSEVIDRLIEDETVGTIILNVAFCDFDAIIDDRGFHGSRLKTSNGQFDLTLRPSEKIIDKIRRKRPDIFLVGFKTTTNADNQTQFLTGLKMMKRSKCNLVLANDTVTRHNMIITPEESKYEAGDREQVLVDLVDMVLDRNSLTYNRTNFIPNDNVPFDDAPETFKTVMEYLINNGGYIENNGNGFTPGHFCYQTSDHSFVSSQRTVNHNDVAKNGMTKIIVTDDNQFTAHGTHKPSVGARSQWMMLNTYNNYDCIIHTHNPLRENSNISLRSQKKYQCGSLQCGENALSGLQSYKIGKDELKAVYLVKHGVNILFRSTSNPQDIIDYLEKNIELGIKIQ